MTIDHRLRSFDIPKRTALWALADLLPGDARAEKVLAEFDEVDQGLQNVVGGDQLSALKLVDIVTTKLHNRVQLVVEDSIPDAMAAALPSCKCWLYPPVRLGGTIDADMVAVPIGPPMRMVTVASPAYLKRYGVPRRPEELMAHRCIYLRLPTHGGLYPWEFTHDGSEFRVRVQGPLIMNSSLQILDACLAGVGLAQVTDIHAQGHIGSGALEEVLAEWSELFPGYHLYYPTRRQQTAAFRVVLEALRSE